ncbi:IS3 family transposase, partial [Escherichia coli]
GKGNCFDNSAVESFFKSLKAELIWRRHWQTRRDIEIAIFEYIRGLTLSGTKTHVKQRFLPLTPLLMVSDVLWSPVLPA